MTFSRRMTYRSGEAGPTYRRNPMQTRAIRECIALMERFGGADIAVEAKLELGALLASVPVTDSEAEEFVRAVVESQDRQAGS